MTALHHSLLKHESSGFARINQIRVRAFKIPTPYPESDGTLVWNETVLVLVELRADGAHALGFGYADLATAHFITTHFLELLKNADSTNIPFLHEQLIHRLRNMGRPGIASMALSIVDIALWDLKARLLGIPLIQLWGSMRPSIPVYASGGFTSYSLIELCAQMSEWKAAGMTRVKMKVGQHPEQDVERVRAVREIIGPQTEFYVDANGAYTRKQALAFAEAYRELGVSWFEEPVSSDDLEGLHFIRDHAPTGMTIAAGEYGYDLTYFQRMLAAQAVDTLQADVTRCGGFTEILKIAALCEAHHVPLSGHTAPTLHTHIALALNPIAHIEYFIDHYRIEQHLFEGAIIPLKGLATVDSHQSGLGLTLREKEAKRFAYYDSH
jgi:L-alanine-DL-glutamate epimerase-like enolase superfamily enzyme